MSFRLSIFFAVLGVLLGKSSLFVMAQETLAPSEQKKQTIITQPITIQKGFLRISTYSQYELLRQSFDVSGKKTISKGDDNIYAPKSKLSYRYTTPLSVKYGISNRLQIELSIPYIIYREQSSFSRTSSDTVNTNSSYIRIYGPVGKKVGDGWGDLILSGQYQLKKEGIDKLGVVTGLTVILPTGRKNPVNVVDAYNYTKPAGEGETLIKPFILLRKVNYPFSYTFQLFYQHSFGGRKKFAPFREYLWADPGFPERKYFYQSPDKVDVSSSISFHVNDWIAIGNGLMYSHQKGKTTKLVSYWKEIVVPDSWAIVYSPLISFQIRRFRLNQFMQVPLMGKNRYADPAFGINLEYTL